MKVVHVPFSFFPDPCGGTEVYVASVAKHLIERGIECLVAAPGRENTAYSYDGLSVVRYALATEPLSLDELYGDGDGVAARNFGEMLDREAPDVVHLHAFVAGVSLLVLREAKRRGIRVFFTYHTPTVSCVRGSLLRLGTEICDGTLDETRCAECVLQSRGLPLAIARIVSRVPGLVADVLKNSGIPSKVSTGFQLKSLISRRHQTVRALFREADHFIAVCDWVRTLLLDLGVDPERVTLCRQGLAQTDVGKVQEPCASLSARPDVKLAFFGRLDPTKGIDVVVQAVRLLPERTIALDVFGIAQGEGGETYKAELVRLAGDDKRIRFLPPVASDRVVEGIAGYDVLLVPSQWLESGPLVVLEAFAADVPVVGSRLGGIAELVADGVDGILVGSYADPMAWAAVFGKLLNESHLVSSLKRGIRRPRTAADVAGELQQLYMAAH